MAVCTGETSADHMLWVLSPGGIARPFHLVTMEEPWFEAAAVLEIPRFFFKTRLALGNFVSGHPIVCVEIIENQTDDTIALASMLGAMGANELPLHSSKGEV